MTWVAVAIGGSAVLGAAASMSAADKQAGATNRAAGVSERQFNLTQRDLLPWVTGGKEAWQQLLGLSGVGGDQFNPNAPLVKPFTLADFNESPSYQFNLQQGEEAINKAAAARGNYYAPTTLRDISRYSQGLAGNEFQTALGNYYNQQNNVWSRLFNLSGAGQNAANQTGVFGANSANIVGQNMIGAGNAQAAGLVGASNAITGGVGDYYNQIFLRDILTRSGYGGGGSATPAYSGVPGI